MAFSEFGKAVKKKLIDLNKPQSWLIEQVTAKTGKYIDNGYCYKIFTGERNPPEIVKAIREILEMEDQ